MKLRDLTNKQFGNLTVLYRAYGSRSNSIKWLCQCFCGNTKTISSDHLTRKNKPVKTCGCSLKRKGKNHPNFTGVGNIPKGWFYDHVLRETRQKYRRKIEIKITIKYVNEIYKKQNGLCTLSGIKLYVDNDVLINTASLDRIDSSLGYIKGNVQFVHKHINMMKRNYDQNYFINMCKQITKYQNKKDTCEIT